MGELDSSVLSQVEDAMGAYGNVLNIKKKGRSIVVFFDNKESAKSLTSNEGNEVTIELGGCTVQLLAGVPRRLGKRLKAQRQAKKFAKIAIRKENSSKKNNRRNAKSSKKQL